MKLECGKVYRTNNNAKVYLLEKHGDIFFAALTATDDGGGVFAAKYTEYGDNVSGNPQVRLFSEWEPSHAEFEAGEKAACVATGSQKGDGTRDKITESDVLALKCSFAVFVVCVLSQLVVYSCLATRVKTVLSAAEVNARRVESMLYDNQVCLRRLVDKQEQETKSSHD